MNFLFLMDPLETVDVHKDTSFAFMLGAQRRKHRIFYVPSGGVSLCEGQVSFEAEPVMPRKDATTPFDRGRPQRLDDRDADDPELAKQLLAEAIGHEVSRYVADRTRVNGWEKELITIADGY